MRKYSSPVKGTTSRLRGRMVGGAFIIGFAVCITRLFFIQVLHYEYYNDIALKQHGNGAATKAIRGEIYARDRTNEDVQSTYPLATNKSFYEVYLDPSLVARPRNVAQVLSDTFDLEYDLILERAQKTGDRYEPVISRATEEQIEQLKKVNLKGIAWRPVLWRYYPDGSIGGQVVGYVTAEEGNLAGRYGIESWWNDSLSGTDKGSAVALSAHAQDTTGVQEGDDIVLTIDRTIQYEVCRMLEEAVKKYDAGRGTVIIMEPATGKIRAMCNVPSFDPNDFSNIKDVRLMNNDAVFSAYEPGSVFKPISMAIALDQGMVTPQTTYEDTGEVTIAGKVIRNFDKQKHGIKTMTQVLQESLNLGIIYATQNVSNRVFYDYLNRFGFGKKTGIEISQEVAGDVKNLKTFQDIYKATASFGQGLTVTPLQMITGINVLANKGVRMKPLIVDEIRHVDGSSESVASEQVERVIAQATADTITGMMTQVVEQGYDHKARVDGYYLAGKTGTALIVENKKYTDKADHTFVGYGPSNNPRFTVLVMMHKVQKVNFASDSTTQLFHDIAEFLLGYYRIPPSR